MSQIFTPFRAGALSLGHRVVMAPLTRMRSSAGDLPNALMRDYYSQRASEGGLIISEATPISRQGYGYGYSSKGEVPFSMPRALERGEIPDIIAEFGAGAARAKAAGFDGVEIHSANGYLPDQFLQDGTNRRTDEYGGPIENRARFLLEVTQAAIDVFGADRVGVRLSPSGTYGSMSDSDPRATFGYAAAQLDAMEIAYLHVVEPRIKGTELIADTAPVAARELRQFFHGTQIAAGGFDGASAEAIIEAGDADAVAFGRTFIANPDLPQRIRLSLPLNAYDRTTFYGGDARGYTDYPFRDRIAA